MDFSISLQRYKNLPKVWLLVIPLLYLGGSLSNNWILSLAGVLLIIVYIFSIVIRDSISRLELETAALIIPVSVILGTTLLSDYLVGTDIHLEYYIYRVRTENLVLDRDISYQTSIGTSIIAPFLTNWLGISGIFIYKILFPLLYSFSFYFIFLGLRKIVGDKLAFLSIILVVLLTPSFIEITGIPRQQLSEFFIGIFILVLLSNFRYRYLVLGLVGSLVVVSHYGSSLLFLGGLGLGSLYPLIRYRDFRLLLLVVTLLVVWYVYYLTVGNGIVLDHIGSIVDQRIGTDANPPKNIFLHDLSNTQNPLHIGLGLDFFEVNILGKLFRILQISSQIFLVVGAYLVVRGNYSTNLKVLVIGGVSLPFLMVILPEIALSNNPTRVYQVALLLSSISITIALFKLVKNKIVVASLVSCYLLFSSGIVFELSQSTNTSYVLPYNIALSNHRIDLGASISSSDLLLLESLDIDTLEKTCSDFYLSLVLNGHIGSHRDYWREDENNNCTYLFIRERNYVDSQLVVWNGVGLREYRPIDISKYQIVDRVGNSLLVNFITN